MVLLPGGGLLTGNDALTGVLDALFPNIVNAADNGLGLDCAAALLSNQLVHFVQLLQIIVGDVNGFLVNFQNNTHDEIPPEKKM